MNTKEIEVLRTTKPGISQRDLAKKLNISLGKVNQIISELKSKRQITGYLF